MHTLGNSFFKLLPFLTDCLLCSCSVIYTVLDTEDRWEELCHVVLTVFVFLILILIFVCFLIKQGSGCMNLSILCSGVWGNLWNWGSSLGLLHAKQVLYPIELSLQQILSSLFGHFTGDIEMDGVWEGRSSVSNSAMVRAALISEV